MESEPVRVQILIEEVLPDDVNWIVRRIRRNQKNVNLHNGPVLKVPEKVAKRWIEVQRAYDNGYEWADAAWFDEVAPQINRMMPKHEKVDI